MCGHQCGGIINEDLCLPCLRGCASLPETSSQMDQAAALVTPARPAPLRQDAEDMCMICFCDPLSAAPAIQVCIKIYGHTYIQWCRPNFGTMGFY